MNIIAEMNPRFCGSELSKQPVLLFMGTRRKKNEGSKKKQKDDNG
jgi:hypothetical protein